MGRLIASALLIAGLAGCQPQCGELCTDWYDYRRDVCGDHDLDDERATCINDYRGALVSDAESEQCEERSVVLGQMRAAGDCCACDDPDPSCCPDGDDDSAVE